MLWVTTRGFVNSGMTDALLRAPVRVTNLASATLLSVLVSMQNAPTVHTGMACVAATSATAHKAFQQDSFG